MGVKKALRAKHPRVTPDVYVSANLSAHHPDYGMNWADHQKEKNARAINSDS
jgi:hypothetical protein